MKYGLLSYEFKRHFNVGDYVQSIAARQFLPQVDRFLNREKLHGYRGEKIRLIMNGWFMFHPENWPPSPDIEPLFVAFHIQPETRRCDAVSPESRLPAPFRADRLPGRTEPGRTRSARDSCLEFGLPYADAPSQLPLVADPGLPRPAGGRPLQGADPAKLL